jgi:hypothetical protein
MPVCATCNDTHSMTLGEREVMCTRCPTPCEKCRSRPPPGPYCQTTPCDCPCHKTATVAAAAATEEARIYEFGRSAGRLEGRAEAFKLVEELQTKWKTIYVQDETAQIVIGELGRLKAYLKP